LQLTCSVLSSSVAVATLGRSGWLILTPQGLSPCKKRQASLGALTISRSAASCARNFLVFGSIPRAARRLQRGVSQHRGLADFSDHRALHLLRFYRNESFRRIKIILPTFIDNP